MDCKELRIGNLIKWGDSIQVIEAIFNYNTELPTVMCNPLEAERYLSEFEPIPLTEEWLKRLGLKYQFDSDTYEINFKYDCNKIIVDLFTKHVCVDTGLNSIYIEHIKFVHQLQNLYFALTGKELTYES
jgi:hypothetical protein